MSNHLLAGNQSNGSEDAHRMKAWRDGDIYNVPLENIEAYFRLTGGHRVYREEAMATDWDDWE